MNQIKGLVGVVHLPPLPGDNGYRDEPIGDIMDRALRDAEALAQGGAHAIIIENFGSAPFHKGTPKDPAPPHQIAAISMVASRIRSAVDLPFGINVLRNDATAALGIAAVTGASFIRVNVHAGAYVTDQGLIEGQAAKTLTYRQQLGQPVKIWADVLVKHATPLAPLSLEQALDDVLKRSGADCAIVTGRSTGHALDEDTLSHLRERNDVEQILVGSGVTPRTVESLPQGIAGAIVGTWLKKDGDITQPVDPKRVRKMANALRDHLA